MVSHFAAISSSAAMSIPCIFLCVRVSWWYIGRSVVAGVHSLCIADPAPPLSKTPVDLGRGDKEPLAPANHLRSQKIGQSKWKTNSTNQVVGCFPSCRSETHRMGSRASPPQKILTAFNEYSQGFIKHFPVWLNKTVFKPPSH